MGAERAANVLLRRLEADVARAAADRPRLVLAFSGGLASLLLAACARKRCDLLCEVVGFPGSADAEAAVVAQSFLDYPVRVLRPRPTEALHVARALLSSDARLSVAEAVSLVPFALVEARHRGSRVLSGFGMTGDSAAIRRVLLARSTLHPGLRPRGNSVPSRAALLGAADLLGIPEPFSRGARRSPSEGSGVGPALRALSHAERTTVSRLLRRIS